MQRRCFKCAPLAAASTHEGADLPGATADPHSDAESCEHRQQMLHDGRDAISVLLAEQRLVEQPPAAERASGSGGKGRGGERGGGERGGREGRGRKR